ncbi:MAG: hypothetical protein GX629_05705 [Phycisphaerae bacterium]|jgi:CRISPR-associated protein Csm4|nr:hypothetical protein [Phycisphaerae bacterium]
MQSYKLKLQVCSALQTPLQPDTLFGHLCWAIRYHEGEQALESFLKSYTQATPPLILSGVFPEHFWPAPLLPGLTQDQQKNISKILSEMPRDTVKKKLPFCPLDKNIAARDLTTFEVFDVLKWLQKLRFIPEAMLSEVVDDMSRFELICRFLDIGCGKANLLSSANVSHNVIDRLTGTVPEENGLYFSEESFPSSIDPPVFQLLVLSDLWDADQIHSRFSQALTGGYGKSKSRGKGYVKVLSVEPWSMPQAKTPNAIILLGTCCPRKTDPTQGFWQIKTKNGKFGGDWALGENPFKKPLTFLEPGSIFKTDSSPAYMGQMVSHISDTYPQALQYGLAPTLAVQCDLKEVL